MSGTRRRPAAAHPSPREAQYRALLFRLERAGAAASTVTREEMQSVCREAHDYIEALVERAR